MDPAIKITNPNGTFALYESGRAEQTEIERYDSIEDAKANLTARLGADPVTLYVIDLAGRQEAYRVVWAGSAPVEALPESAAAPEVAPTVAPEVTPEAAPEASAK